MKRYESKVEAVIETPEKLPVTVRNVLRAPVSLRPGQNMMDGCISRHPESIAIRDAWRFKEPVRVVSQAEWNRLTSRNPVTFHG